MDRRLRILEPPRSTTTHGVTAETPLVTLAWHALRSEHRRQTEHAEQTRDNLVRIAEELGPMRRAATAAMAQENGLAFVQSIRSSAARIETALKNMGITLVGKERVPFDGELTEVLDNVAQIPQTDLESPLVAEIIEQAIFWNETLVRRGKAVIAIPVPADRGGRIGPAEDISDKNLKSGPNEGKMTE